MSKTLVIVPTYNERENLPRMAERLLQLPVTVDLLVVDDNSPDGTGEMADQLAAAHPSIHVLHRQEKNGLGRAYLAGFAWALARDFEFILEMDGDFSHNPDDIPKFLEAAQNADLVLGSRYCNGIRVINWPLRRLLLSTSAARYVRAITGMPFTDPTGGFKCFRRLALQSINLDTIRSNGYSFQIEMTHRIWQKGLRVAEVPIIFTERFQGCSKMSGNIVWEALIMVWRLWSQCGFRRSPRGGAAPPAAPSDARGSAASGAEVAPMSLREEMTQLARQAKAASRQLARLTTAQKNSCLLAMADALERNRAAILQANDRDMDAGAKSGLSSAMLDRLKLDEKRIAAMAQGLREVAALPDPVGRILDDRLRPNGLRLKKISTPIGVVVIIYESRPNVTADAASLCFKSGNAVILRGGKEAIHSNQAIAETLSQAAGAALAAFPAHAIQVVRTTERDAVKELLALTQYVDLCMPRGGESLIRAVAECSKVPVIKHYKGVCHVYVDAAADLKMAEEIALNAKCQRPAVCNAMETLLVDKAIAAQFLPRLAAQLDKKKVELRADDSARNILQSALPHPAAPIKSVTAQDYQTEYNDYILNIRVVDGVRQAIEHINQYGSAHSDSIVTGDEARAQEFLAQVDSAAVYWNASTRFTDGGEFGMGAEIGISTDKIGARGPMGLDELTTYKWLGVGHGQVRT